MPLRLHGRALIACLLALVGLSVIAASLTSAQSGGRRPHLAAATPSTGHHHRRHRHHHGQYIAPGGSLAPSTVAAPGPAGAAPRTPPGPEFETESGPAPIPAGVEPPESSPPPIPAGVEEPPAPTPEPEAGEPPAPTPSPEPETAEPPEPSPPPIPAGVEEPPTPAPEPAEPPAPAPAPEPEAEPPAPEPAPGTSSIYWGAWIGDQLTGMQAPWDMNAVSKFEQMTGKSMSLIHFSSPFADCSSSPCSFYKFPTGPMESIRAHGSIPFFSWASQSTPAGANEPAFQLADVIAGNYDSYIREFAEGAKQWGHPFFLRFNWEMNGNWFEWSEGVNGNAAGEYVAAWRHVHDIFGEVGATNATWVWCPNVDPENSLQGLASLYPGDEYVDWTGLDGYNWGTNPVRPDKWRSFDQLYESTYEEITETIAPSKPLIVGEVGSTEVGGSKANWIEEMLSTVPANYPKIHGLLYFEKFDDGMDWPLETSPAATEAFANGIHNGAYAGNQFGALRSGPVPVSG